MRICIFALAAVSVALCSGCGGNPTGVVGGTKGLLTTGNMPLPDVQINVFRVDGETSTAVGFAITAADGSFELLTNGAKGPLDLASGEYRFTLETAGAPIEFAEEYYLPDKTPLKVYWTSSTKLEWDVPVISVQ